MKRLTRPEPSPAEAARLGEQLRDARMALGLSIEDMSASLRIRRVYLAALEEGRVRDLPAPAYVIGFVRSYARALGLDDQELVQRFREAGNIAAQRKTLVFPEPVPQRGVPAGAVILVGAVAMIGAYLAWYNWTGAGSRSVDTVPPLPPRIETAARDANPAWNDPPPTPPGPAVNPPPGTAAGPPPPPGGAAPPAPRPAAPPPAAAPRPDEPRILLRARADTWIQVRDRGAGTVVMNKLLHPGETWQVPPREGLFLTIGNVSGLEILVDGQVINPPAAASRVSRDIPLDAERLKSGAAYVPAATAPAPGAPPTGGARPAVPPANPAVPMPQ